jgi:trigger factor
MSIVKTNVSELPESRVRVEAEVPAEEVERRVQQAARELGRQMRIPGFRKGKVPPPVVIRRLGREAVLDEALRNSLGGWYADAIDGAGIATVGEPELDVGELPSEGQPLAFSIEIGVRPQAKLGEYKGLEVGRREAQVSQDAIDEEVERLRDRFATLETVERPAAEKDHVVVDYVGSIDGEPFEGGEGRDQLIELGSGRLIPGFEDQLAGAQAGETRTVNVTFPEDYGDHGGQNAAFEVTVKEVKSKRLPELDDDFASDAAGFETLQELRDDISKRLKEVDERQIEREFEDAVIGAAVAAATVEVPDKLVHARAHEMLDQMLSALARQGINKETYLQITGKDEEAIAHEAEPEAAEALKREAVLAAIVDAEQIEPTDEELLEAISPVAERDNVKPEKLLERLRKSGRIDRLREDLATTQAIKLLVDHAKPISVEQAKAQPDDSLAAEERGRTPSRPASEKLWTPGKDEPEGGSGRLWTPSS